MPKDAFDSARRYVKIGKIMKIMKIRSILLIALVVSGITLVKGKDVKPQICYFNSEVKKKEADGIFSKAATLLANRKTNKKLSFFEIVS